MQPVVHTTHKWSVMMKLLIKKELECLLDQGIIVSVTESTDWVNSLASSWKSKLKFHFCLDMYDLNELIKHDHYDMQTLKGIMHELASSPKLMKPDNICCYFCIILNGESSYFTIFNLPLGCFYSVCLPFGLIYSQDISQQMIDLILNCCKGMIGIADEMVIHSKTTK